jgi:predicted Zn-dependent peptidase
MKDGTRIERAVLSNGLTVVVERMPHFPSVTAGVWVKRGSRQEAAATNGASHFVEHLVFKGTPTRTYGEIYKTFDRMGGVLDAFTSREIMGFYFRVQKSHFPEAFEVLADILVNATFPEGEVERERGVILEEIKMVTDTPSDLMGDLYLERAYPGHPVGRPIQGTGRSVSALGRAAIMKHHKEMMRPPHLVVTATGDTTLKEVLRQVEPVLGRMRGKKSPEQKIPSFEPGQALFQKDHLEQAQIVAGFESEPSRSPHRHALLVLANLLGGTMSSRLFTELREKRGLVYSVSAEHMSMTDIGLFTVQAATSHAKASRTIRETFKVLRDLAKSGPTEEDLLIAKDNLLGGIILSLESPSARMGRLARNELYFGRQKPVQEMIDGITKVTAKDLHARAREVFRADSVLLGVLGRESALKGEPLGLLEGS